VAGETRSAVFGGVTCDLTLGDGGIREFASGILYIFIMKMVMVIFTFKSKNSQI
jgi:hypothetical protein